MDFPATKEIPVDLLPHTATIDYSSCIFDLPSVAKDCFERVIKRVCLGKDPSYRNDPYFYERFFLATNRYRSILQQLHWYDMQVEKLSERKLVALFVILWCCNNNKYMSYFIIFGGFVRDLFSGADFADVDVWTNRYRCMPMISDPDVSVQTIKYCKDPANTYDAEEPVTHVKYNITYKPLNVTFPVDITLGKHIDNMGVDFGCNSIYIDISHNTKLVEFKVRKFGEKYDPFDAMTKRNAIIADIQKRIARGKANVPTYRIERMKEKGYTIVVEEECVVQEK
jgi:hypothetical protein